MSQTLIKCETVRKVLFIPVILLILCSGAVFAQDSTQTKPQKFKYRKSVKLAKNKTKAGDLYGAADVYENILENKPEATKIAWQLAEAYHLTRDYKNALKYYKMVLESADKDNYPQAQYWYAMMLKMTGQYIDAKTQFNEFAKSYKGENSSVWRKWAQIEVEGCDLAITAMENPETVNLYHLDEKVNHPYTDISPLQWDDTTLVYATLPTDTVPVADNTRQPAHLIKLFRSNIVDGAYTQSEPFPQFDIEGLHIANGAFSPDKSRFYFSACTEKSVGNITCAVYVSEKKDGQWQEPVELGDDINLEGYTSTQPTVGPYRNNREVLYFVSDRPAGKGGKDIWYSIISNGRYSKPRNCGNKINTNRDEATPYFDAANGTLYFSSTGLPGFGGYDVFSTTGAASRWTEPENVGYPINSQTDDMYFRYNSNQKSGYFTSNRPGVYALKSETCCDDLFSFELYKTLNIAVTGMVYDEAAPTVPLDGAKASLYISNYQGLGDILVNEMTIENGKKYLFDLNADTEYKIVGSKDGYLSNSVSFNTNGITESDTLEYNIMLRVLVKNQTYSLRNIYYDYDKSSLRDESKPTLDSLYQLLVENPGIVIEIGSHTDTRGADSYNLRLSQKRAESVVKYLIDKGIDAKRLQAKGYGETKPLADCNGVEGCSNESNSPDCPCHQKNRRTEFIITGETDIDINYEDERYEDEAPTPEKKNRRGNN